MTPQETNIYLDDCQRKLKEFDNNSIDLIFTSPPYADSRKDSYGGIHPNNYVEWFLPITEELHRVLKVDGTFVLNIKEKVVNGERHTYVIDLIKEMRKQGWLWTEEFIWHKKNSHPGKWPNRFRDGWERLLQFNKSKKFNMYQEEVMVPVGSWAKSRLKNLSKTDKTRDNSKSGSGFGKNVSNWLDRTHVYPDNVLELDEIKRITDLPEEDLIRIIELVKGLTSEELLPSNVLHLATVCNNKGHSAAFPDELPEWFIKLFTKKNDVVLDPFMGSGTTVIVADRLKRIGLGIEIVKDYYKLAKQNLIKQQPVLLEPKEKYGEAKSKKRKKLRSK
ncbi:MAG: site-specific DNA-methyltransferase [Melioribacteraceae bacterium]|nr:site-specific DNA-methyltransferase [Melioribacteraceae bacterium]